MTGVAIACTNDRIFARLAALMGAGGVMAFGCSIGQGLTGFSTLALASLIAFAGILVGTAAGLRGALRVRPLAAA